jgi:Tfp pilus assembly protein PilN
MRNLESSPWLEQPALVEIKAVIQNNQRLSEFQLNVTLSRAKAEADNKKKPAPGKAAAISNDSASYSFSTNTFVPAATNTALGG